MGKLLRMLRDKKKSEEELDDLEWMDFDDDDIGVL